MHGCCPIVVGNQHRDAVLILRNRLISFHLTLWMIEFHMSKHSMWTMPLFNSLVICVCTYVYTFCYEFHKVFYESPLCCMGSTRESLLLSKNGFTSLWKCYVLETIMHFPWDNIFLIMLTHSLQCKMYSFQYQWWHKHGAWQFGIILCHFVATNVTYNVSHHSGDTYPLNKLNWNYNSALGRLGPSPLSLELFGAYYSMELALLFYYSPLLQ